MARVTAAEGIDEEGQGTQQYIFIYYVDDVIYAEFSRGYGRTTEGARGLGFPFDSVVSALGGWVEGVRKPIRYLIRMTGTQSCVTTLAIYQIRVTDFHPPYVHTHTPPPPAPQYRVSGFSIFVSASKGENLIAKTISRSNRTAQK